MSDIEKSLYPQKIDEFRVNINATGIDDDREDVIIYAEDVNKLQNAIVAIEKTLGVNPQGEYTDISQSFKSLNSNRAFSLPRIALYKGNPINVNGSSTAEEAATYFKYMSIVLLDNIDLSLQSADISDVAALADNTYFYIGLNAGDVSTLLSIDTLIPQAKEAGIKGIWFKNFGYEFLDREKQNALIDSAHSADLAVIASASNTEQVLGIDQVLSIENYLAKNPTETPISLGSSDGYLSLGYAVGPNSYQNYAELKDLSEKMIDYRSAIGVSIYGLARFPDMNTKEQSNKQYYYVQAVAALYSLNGIYASPATVQENTLSLYPSIHIPASYSDNDVFVTYQETYDKKIGTRMSNAGRISVDFYNHTYDLEDAKIPLSIIDTTDGGKLDASSLIGEIPGNVAIDIIDRINASDDIINSNNIEFDGKSIIEGINTVAQSPTKISSEAIEELSTTDIEQIVVDALTKNLQTLLDGGTYEASLTNLIAEFISAQNMYVNNIVGEIGTFEGLNAKYLEAGSITTDLIATDTITSDKLTIHANAGVNKWTATIVKKDSPGIKLTPSSADINGKDVYRTIELVDTTKLIVSDYIGAVNDYVVLYETNVFCNGEYIPPSSYFDANSNARLFINNSLISSTADGVQFPAIYFVPGWNKVQIYQDHNSELECFINLSSSDKSLSELAFLNEKNLSEATPIMRVDAYAEKVTQIMGDMIKTGTIDAVKIIANSITAEQLSADAITVDLLTANILNAISAKIVEASIDSADIGNLTAEQIEAKEVAAYLIKAINLDAGVINAEMAKIASAAIGVLTAENIGANSITTDKLDAEEVGAGLVSAGILQAIEAYIQKLEATEFTAEDGEINKLLNQFLSSKFIDASNIKIVSEANDGFNAGQLVIDNGGLIVSSVPKKMFLVSDEIMNRIFGRTFRINISDKYSGVSISPRASDGSIFEPSFWLVDELTDEITPLNRDEYTLIYEYGQITVNDSVSLTDKSLHATYYYPEQYYSEHIISSEGTGTSTTIAPRIVKIDREGIKISNDGGRPGTWQTKLDGGRLYVEAADISSVNAETITAGTLFAGDIGTESVSIASGGDYPTYIDSSGLHSTNFRIDSMTGDIFVRGIMTAEVGSRIANWNIDENTIYDTGANIVLDSADSSITIGAGKVVLGKYAIDEIDSPVYGIKAEAGKIGKLDITPLGLQTIVHDELGSYLGSLNITEAGISALIGETVETALEQFNLAPDTISLIGPEAVTINTGTMVIKENGKTYVSVGKLDTATYGMNIVLYDSLGNPNGKYIQLDQKGLRSYNGTENTIDIDSDGSVSITGTVNAKAGYFGSSDNGAIINPDGIEIVGAGQIKNSNTVMGTDNITVYSGLTELVVIGKYDTDKYGISITNGTINLGGSFIVSETGSLTSTDGNIAGWTIGESTISKGSVSMDSTNETISTPGAILGKYADIDGLPYYGLKADTGYIGGWKILNNALSTPNISIESNTELINIADQVLIGKYGVGENDYGIKAGDVILSDNGLAGTGYSLNEDGILASKGTIGGWTLNETSLESIDPYAPENKITISSAGQINLADKIVLNRDGSATIGLLNIFSNGSLSTLDDKFVVDSDGNLFINEMTATNGSFTGTINATSGWFGNPERNVSITENGLEAGGVIINDDGITLGFTGVVIKDTGISMGTTLRLDHEGLQIANGTNSSINLGGVFIANQYGITSIAGTIGGWLIEDTTLSGGKTVLNSNGTITVKDINNVDTIILDGSTGKLTATDVDLTGKISAISGAVGNWLIGETLSSSLGAIVLDPTDEIITVNNNDTENPEDQVILGQYEPGKYGLKAGPTILDSNGIAATGGVIGGWNITDTDLTSNNVSIDSSGQITLGANNEIVFNKDIGISVAEQTFAVDLSGHMTAQSATISGTVIATEGSIGNWHISGGAIVDNIAAPHITIATDSINIDNQVIIGKYDGVNYGIKAEQGTIGGWQISPDKISAPNIELNSSGTISIGKDTNPETLDTPMILLDGVSGRLTARNLEAVGGTIGGITITNNSIESGGFSLSSSGQLNASSVNLTGEIHADMGTFGVGSGALKASELGIWNGIGIGDPLSTFWITSQTVQNPVTSDVIPAGSAFFKGTVSVGANSVIDGGNLVIEDGGIIAGNPAGDHVRMTYDDANGGGIYSYLNNNIIFKVNQHGAYFEGDITATRGTISGGLSVGNSGDIFIDGTVDSSMELYPAIYLYDAKEDRQKIVRLNSEGLYISENGGATYLPALTGGGISANVSKDGVLTIDDSGSSASGVLIRQWDTIKNDYVDNVTITPSGINVLNGAITVYSDSTGEVLIGGGYLRVKGLDMGVVTSNNYIGNGNFNMVSENYGVMQKNKGEIFLGRAQSSGGTVSNPTYHYVGWPDYGTRHPHTIYTYKLDDNGLMQEYDPELLTDLNKGTLNFPNVTRSSFNPQWSKVHPIYPYCIVPADADNFCTVLDYEGNIVKQLKAWKGGLFGVDFTPDGNRMIVCGDDMDRKRAPWDMVVFDTSSPNPQEWSKIGVIYVGEFPSKVVCDDQGFAYVTVSLDNTIYKLDMDNMRVDKIITLTDNRGIPVIPLAINMSSDFDYIYVGGVVSDFLYEIPTAMDRPISQCRKFSVSPYQSNRGIIHDTCSLPNGRIATSSASVTDACITIIDPNIEVVDEAITFNTNSKTLSTGSPKLDEGHTITITSEPKGTVGLITYTKDVDYTVNIHMQTISRIEGGAIAAGQTVYVEYTGGGIITWIDATMDGIHNSDGSVINKLATPADASAEIKNNWNFFSSTTLNHHPTLPLLYVTVTNRCAISTISYEDGYLQELQRIPAGSNPSGVSISTDGKRLYTPNHHYHTYPLGANKIWGYRSSDNFYSTDDVFDTTQRYWHHNPAGMVTTGNGRYLWTANRATDKIVVIDTTTWEDLNTWVNIENVGHNPYEMKINNTETKIYVSNNDASGKSEPDFITIIDVATRQIDGRIYVGDEPIGICLSNDSKYLYAACSGVSMVQKINLQNNKVIASIIVEGKPTHVHLVEDKVYATCADTNMLYCLNAGTLSLVSEIACDQTPMQMIDINGKLYVTNQGADNVMVIDIATNTVENRIPTGSRPGPIAYNAIHNVVYVGNSGEGSVCLIDPNINEVTEWAMTGDNPEYITVDPTGEHWYVTAHGPEDIVSYGTGDPYTGDAYLDNNGVAHKYGSTYWMPSRSSWARGEDNTLTSFSSVEFWPSAELQGKQGYSHISVMGMYDAYAMIEQDVYPLLNASDGACEYKTETIDLLQGISRELEEDVADYRDIPGRENRRIAVWDAMDPSKKFIENIHYRIDYKENTITRIGDAIKPSRIRANTAPLIGTNPVLLIETANEYNEIKVYPLNMSTEAYEEGVDYTIQENTNGNLTISRIIDGRIKNESAVSVEYWYHIKVRYYYHPFKRNYDDVVFSSEVFWRWPRPENQYVSMEIDELIPKPIYVDNDQVNPWRPTFDYGRGYYNSVEGRTEYRDNKNKLLSEIPEYKGLIYSGNSDRAKTGSFTPSVTPIGGTVDNLSISPGNVVLPAGQQYITLDIGNDYYINEINVTHNVDSRTINDVRVEVSSDEMNWERVYENASAPSTYSIKFNKVYDNKPYNGSKVLRFIRFYSNGNSVDSNNEWKNISVKGDWKVNSSYSFSSDTVWDSEGVRETYLTLSGSGENNKIRFDNPGFTTDPESALTSPAHRVRYRIYYSREDGTHNVRGELQVFSEIDGDLFVGRRSDEEPGVGVHYDYVYNYITNTLWRTEDSNIGDGEEVRILYRFVQENLSNLPLSIPKRDPDTGIENRQSSVAETDITGAWVEWNFTNEYRCDWYVGWIADIGLGNIAIYLDGKLTHSISQATAKIERFSQISPDLIPGEHTIRLVQQQGRVNFDIIKLEDYQLHYRNSSIIASPALNPVELFDWYPTKLSPGESRKYLGRGAQVISGAYDTIQTDKVTRIPNHQVPIKYRVRFKTELIGRGEAVDGIGGSGGEAVKNEFKFERGSVMITNVTMEMGVNPTYWRMAPAADKYPGFAIESWDIKEPMYTGIQTHHLANGSITGDKIKKFEIKDIHISSNAAIQESKIALNHPTHAHGNKDFLDLMEGFGTNGNSNLVARADHNHNDSEGNFDINGDLVVRGSIKEIGKAKLVHSRPLYGLGGDPQFQTNSYSWENIVNHYDLFGHGTPIVEDGFIRKYKLYSVYGDNIVASDLLNARIRIVTSGTSPKVVYEWKMPYMGGATSGRGDAYSDFFLAPAISDDHNIQIEIQNDSGSYAGTSKEIGLEWLELIAYDVFEEVPNGSI